MRLPVILVAALFLTSTGHGEESAKSVTIPLDQIWAYRMPETIPIKGTWSSSSHTLSEETTLLNGIRSSLQHSTDGEETKTGFAVAGDRLDALRELNNVLSKDLVPTSSLQSGSEMWLTFFSYQSAAYVQVREATRHGNTFTIKYRIVPHRTRELTEHVALIPAGKLPDGDYTVRLVRLPMESQAKEELVEGAESISKHRLVCGDYSFSVSGQQEK